MKLFDFKFLILLALALVVYFMYKELEYQRDRVNFCEEKIKEFLSNKDLAIEENKLIPLPEREYDDNQVKNLNLTLPSITNNFPVMEEEIEESSSTYTSRNTNNNNNKKLQADSEESEVESEIQKASDNKHVEIYSNDNDLNLETTISDSLIKQNKVLDNSEETSEQKSSDKKSTKSHETSELSENEGFLNESNPESDSDDKNKYTQNSDLEKVLKDLKEEISNEDNDVKIDKNSETSKVDLTKMKLPELQNLAKTKKINIEKKINGSTKKKTKQELIEELSQI